MCVCVCWDHLRSTLLATFQHNMIISYDHHAALWISQTYSSYIIETSHTLTNISVSHTSLSLMTTTLLTISMNLTFLDFTCKWDHAVFVFLCLAYLLKIMSSRGLPGGTSDKESTCNTGETRGAGSISGSGRTPEGGNGNPLQYSCLGNLIDRRAWWATVDGVTMNWTQLCSD